MKKKLKKTAKLPTTQSVPINTITDKDNRFVVGMKLVDENRHIVQVILLKPPCVKSVIESLPPETLLAMREFVGRVVDALKERGFQIATQWRA